MENLEVGLLLMVVGMTTVFAILLLVIYLGKGLILLVNKYASEEIAVKKQASTHSVQMPKAVPATSPSNLPHTVAIISAVSTLTEGQGKVSRIEKL